MLESLRGRLAWLLCARLARERRPRHLDALRGRPAHTEGPAADRTPGGLQPILTAEGCGLDSNRLSWQGPGVRAARSASELLRPGVEAGGGVLHSCRALGGVLSQTPPGPPLSTCPLGLKGASPLPGLRVLELEGIPKSDCKSSCHLLSTYCMPGTLRWFLTLSQMLAPEAVCSRPQSPWRQRGCGEASRCGQRCNPSPGTLQLGALH